MSTSKTVSRWSLVLAVMLPFVACSRGPSPEVQARLDGLQAQRDSLARTLAEQAASIQSMTRQIEEAFGEMGGGAAENLGDRIAALRDNVMTARTQVDEAQQRIATLNRRAAGLRDSLASVVRRTDATLMAQRDSIARLVASTDAMEARVDELAEARSGLEASVSSLEEDLHTVYYTVGTRSELLGRGVVEEEGGARILLVLWRAGETLVPARALDPSDFEAFDSRSTPTIDLPGSGTYRIVSRQNTEYLEPRPDGHGRFAGTSLRITDPGRFWRSPYLIIEREN